jgi:macrodomain Ter protein organizer (MatP/YcbG family)
MSTRRTISASVSYKTWRVFKAHSSKIGVPVSEIVTKLIEEYMTKNGLPKD